MRKVVVLIAVAVGLVIVGAVVAGSTKSIHTYKAGLSSGAEIPKPKAPARAKGAFAATVTDSGTVRTIKWKLTFSALSGKAVAAHIHKGKAGVAGGVLVPLCGPCASGQTGQAKISRAAVDALERGITYVNVHTAKNAGGEIRGQIKLLEQPGSSPSPSPGEEPTTTTPVDGGGSSDPGAGY
jgi:hypothetical protein